MSCRRAHARLASRAVKAPMTTIAEMLTNKVETDIFWGVYHRTLADAFTPRPPSRYAVDGLFKLP
jgi:hypothetical protein